MERVFMGIYGVQNSADEWGKLYWFKGQEEARKAAEYLNKKKGFDAYSAVTRPGDYFGDINFITLLESAEEKDMDKERFLKAFRSNDQTEYQKYLEDEKKELNEALEKHKDDTQLVIPAHFTVTAPSPDIGTFCIGHYKNEADANAIVERYNKGATFSSEHAFVQKIAERTYDVEKSFESWLDKQKENTQTF